MHGVWKPAVQRLIDAKDANGKQPVEKIIAEHKDKKQAEKDAASEVLAVYRERHFVAIFEAIRTQYQELYDKHAKTGFRDSMFAGLLEKVPPEHLKLEWFMEPRQRARGYTHPSWTWKAFSKNDPLMKELRSVKGGQKWENASWVEKWAKEKIAMMEIVFPAARATNDAVVHLPWNSSFPHWNIPATCMKNEIGALAEQWHLQRASDGGVQELLVKMTAANGKGIQCPWTGRHRPLLFNGGFCFETLEQYMKHFRLHHWDILIFGDTDWLIGHPSRWWLPSTPTESGANHETHQVTWLRQWWPDRWKEENVQILETWRDNGGFHGENICTW